MSQLNYDGENVYKYSMELFSETGHTINLTPEFINHTPEKFSYFDNQSNKVFTQYERNLLRRFNNISRLFSYNDCAFFSLNLLVNKRDRSLMAHDIHTMLHPIIDSEGTVFVFFHEGKIMFSFMGFGFQCVLSDWYSLENNLEEVLLRLDISNMSIENSFDYFTDMIFVLARDYYLKEKPLSHSLIPIDFISNPRLEESLYEDIRNLVKEAITFPERDYGDDYVEYQKIEKLNSENKGDLGLKLDLVLLDTEEISEDEEGTDSESEVEDNQTIDEFADIDQRVLDDPLLMLELIKKLE